LWIRFVQIDSPFDKTSSTEAQSQTSIFKIFKNFNSTIKEIPVTMPQVLGREVGATGYGLMRMSNKASIIDISSILIEENGF
jgi:hypothetical protein